MTTLIDISETDRKIAGKVDAAIAGQVDCPMACIFPTPDKSWNSRN